MTDHAEAGPPTGAGPGGAPRTLVLAALAAAVVAAATALTGCGARDADSVGGGGPSRSAAAAATSAPAPCVDPFTSYPHVSLPWLPADLPLPAGTQPSADYSQPGRTGNAAQLVVPGTSGSFVTFVRQAWPAAGWTLVRDEHDPHDAEMTFSKGPTEGSLHVVDGTCGTVSLVVLGLGPRA